MEFRTQLNYNPCAVRTANPLIHILQPSGFSKGIHDHISFLLFSSYPIDRSTGEILVIDRRLYFYRDNEKSTFVFEPTSIMCTMVSHHQPGGERFRRVHAIGLVISHRLANAVQLLSFICLLDRDTPRGLLTRTYLTTVCASDQPVIEAK
jgi:hypothetical protein